MRNPEGVLYGHLPNFPLSDRGVQQAHAQGRFLATTGATHIHASPLLRAQQTAEIVAGHIGGATITTTVDLVEARFGHYLEGIKPAQVPWRRPLWMIHMVRPGLLPNDETVEQMAARVERPIRHILATAREQGGILVSHGDPIQAFWVHALGRPSWALHRLQCAKGGMLLLDYTRGQLGDIEYRPPESSETGPGDARSEAGDIA